MASQGQATARRAEVVHAIRNQFPTFFMACPPSRNYVYGYHTIRMLEECQKAISAVESGKCYYARVHMPPQHGKALAIDTPIPTPSGWSTIGDLEVGDELFDERGRVCHVVAKTETWKNRPVYMVFPDDGDPVLADAEHEWVVRLDRKRPVLKCHTTEHLANRRGRNAMVVAQGPLDLPDADLPLDPYVLGVWLGDGRTAGAFITAGVQEDREFIRSQIEKAGFECRSHKDEKNFAVVGLGPILKAIGLHGYKRIPEQYLRASAAQRLALLQGLIDTDGHVAPAGQVEFCSISFGLAEGVQELVRSLGYKAMLMVGHASVNGKDCGLKYRVMFYMPGAARLPRKAVRCKRQTRRPGRYLTVYPDGRADTVCIQVDAPSGMFLCGRAMLPTHNSDCASRRLPAFFHLRNPDLSCILASYSSELATYLCGEALSCAARMGQFFIDSDRRTLDVSPSQRKDFWQAKGHRGVVRAVGLGASITGFPASLLIVDDYCKNRAEAESQIVRERVAESFRNDLFSRLAPCHAVIMIATRWHEDDLAGRTERWAAQDSHFPKFQEIRFPAERNGKYLFPERYPDSYYLAQKSMGHYAWQSLFMNDPKPRQGNMLRADLVKFIGRDQLPQGLTWVRGWDIASTEKERIKDDPDFSVGTKAAYHRGNRAIYIDDLRRGQWSTLERDKNIVTAAREDGPGVTVKIEAVAGYVDTYKRVKRELAGEIIVRQCNPSADKVARASVMEPCFEAGNVYVVCDGHPPAWFNEWKSEFLSFPSAKHDDQVDSLTIAVYDALTKAETTFSTL